MHVGVSAWWRAVDTPKVVLRLIPATIVAAGWAWSGWYSAGRHFGTHGLIVFDSGYVLVQVIRDAFPITPERFLAETWYPEELPRAGLVRKEKNGIRWSLPCLHYEFSSLLGGWWFIRLPLWLAFVLAMTWPLWWLRRERCRRRVTAAGQQADAGDAIRLRDRSRRHLLFCLSALAVVGLVWIGTGLYEFTFSYPGQFAVLAGRGLITVMDSREYMTGSFWHESIWTSALRREHFELSWTLPHTARFAQSTVGRWREINIPLWFIVAVLAMPTTIMARRALRPMPGHCACCGYNLTGNVSGHCPECGRLLHPAQGK